jgi:hypothetical protein
MTLDRLRFVALYVIAVAVVVVGFVVVLDDLAALLTTPFPSIGEGAR